MSKLPYTVGQKLWFVSARNKQQQEVTVTKVGRLWVELNNRERINAKGCADGGKYMSPGTCYASRGEYEQQQARSKKWFEIKRKLDYAQMPDSLTLADLEYISKLLGLTQD